MNMTELLTEQTLEVKQISRIFNAAEQLAAQQPKKFMRSPVNAKRLVKMWQKSQKPTDKDSIYNILDQAGFQPAQIEQISKAAKIKLARTSVQDRIEKGTQVTTDTGDTYTWMGAMWKNNKTGRMAKKEMTPQLNQLARQPKPEEPTPAGGQPAPSGAGSADGADVKIDLKKLAAAIKQKGLGNEVKQYLLQSLKER